MSKEIELKFEIDHNEIERLEQYLSIFLKHQPKQLQLSNIYYDTADYSLRQQGCGLRVRGSDGHFEITMKKDGKAIAGLYERAEFNANLPNSELNLSALPIAALPANCDVNQLQNKIMPLFSTDFKRQVWLLSFYDSEIEVALDQGIIKSKDQQIPIHELELELKQGEQKDLLKFAMQLAQFNIHLFSQSKAARGYRLIQGRCLEQALDLTSDNVDLATLLQYWQANEEYALENNNLSFYQKTLNSVQCHLEPIIKQADDGAFTLLAQTYLYWCEQMKLITDVKSFAYSGVNTQLKLQLISFLLTN